MRFMMMVAAVAMVATTIPAAGFAAATAPYKLNAAGKCVGANGQFAAASKCTAPKPAPAARCRDKTSKKFVKCGTANSEPVPTAATH